MGRIGSRGWAVRLMVALALTCIHPAFAAAAPGDVDGDGVTNLSDVLLVLRASLHLQTLTPAQAAVADVAPRPGTGGRLYGDGKVDIADATRLLQFVVGLISADDLAPVDATALYTLNAGPMCNGPATVSKIDLAKFALGANDAVTLDAFAVGTTPNQMVVRGDTGYVVDSGDNLLQTIDLTTGKILGSVDFGANTNPSEMALVGNMAFVSLLIPGTVAVVDLTKNQVVKSLTTAPGAEAVLATQGKVYVTDTAFLGYDPVAMKSSYGQGTVTVIDPTTETVVRTLSVPTNPQAMALDPLGRIHVVSTGDYGAIPGAVTVIDPKTDTTVGTVAIGGSPSFIAITFQGKAYLSDSTGLTVYDARTLTVLKGPAQAIPVSPGPWDLSTDPRGRVFVDVLSADKVDVFDSFTDAPLGEIAVGPCPEALAIQ